MVKCSKKLSILYPGFIKTLESVGRFYAKQLINLVEALVYEHIWYPVYLHLGFVSLNSAQCFVKENNISCLTEVIIKSRHKRLLNLQEV